MADYQSMKVPELKKLLGERGLTQSGNKADLIARLQANDKESESSSKPAAADSTAEDEIDWDDDVKTAESNKLTATAKTAEEPAAAKETAPEVVPAIAEVPAPVVPAEAEKSTPTAGVAAPATDSNGAEPATSEGDKKDGDATSAAAVESAQPVEPAFSQHLEATDADAEAKRREARAKRFGIVQEEGDQDKKKAERAKRFGVENANVPKGLDSALPERSLKRSRGGDADGSRSGKRQTPDRRDGGRQNGNQQQQGRPNRGGNNRTANRNGTGGAAGSGRGVAAKKSTTILADPDERRKADARAKRFATSS